MLQNLAGLLNAVGGQSTQLGQLIHNFNVWSTGLAGERTQLGSTIDGLATLNSALAGVLATVPAGSQREHRGLASATATLPQDQARLNGVSTVGHPVLAALSKTVSSGSYVNVYICNLTIDVNGRSISPSSPGVTPPAVSRECPAPLHRRAHRSTPTEQFPHTRNCP